MEIQQKTLVIHTLTKTVVPVAGCYAGLPMIMVTITHHHLAVSHVLTFYVHVVCHGRYGIVVEDVLSHQRNAVSLHV